MKTHGHFDRHTALSVCLINEAANVRRKASMNRMMTQFKMLIIKDIDEHGGGNCLLQIWSKRCISSVFIVACYTYRCSLFCHGSVMITVMCVCLQSAVIRPLRYITSVRIYCSSNLCVFFSLMFLQLKIANVKLELKTNMKVWVGNAARSILQYNNCGYVA